MDITAAVLLGLFGTGYLVFAGADIGVGMLLPFLGRTAAERRLVVAAIAPYFLGSEVWLVATAGVLAGAFPVLEGGLMTGLFPVIVTLLAGWIARDTGLWLRGRAETAWWRAVCDTAVCAGSWVVAGSWGVAFAGAGEGGVAGTSVGAGGVVLAVIVTALFAAHGLAFAGVRLGGGSGRDRTARRESVLGAPGSETTPAGDRHAAELRERPYGVNVYGAAHGGPVPGAPVGHRGGTAVALHGGAPGPYGVRGQGRYAAGSRERGRAGVGVGVGVGHSGGGSGADGVDDRGTGGAEADARPDAPGTRALAASGPIRGPRLFALTSVAMAGIALGLGLRLPVLDGVADAATLDFVVPAILLVTPFLLAAQVGMWWLFRGRVEVGFF